MCVCVTYTFQTNPLFENNTHAHTHAYDAHTHTCTHARTYTHSRTSMHAHMHTKTNKIKEEDDRRLFVRTGFEVTLHERVGGPVPPCHSAMVGSLTNCSPSAVMICKTLWILLRLDSNRDVGAAHLICKWSSAPTQMMVVVSAET